MFKVRVRENKEGEKQGRKILMFYMFLQWMRDIFFEAVQLILYFIFQMIDNMKKQFAQLLYDIGFLTNSCPKNPAANIQSGP